MAYDRLLGIIVDISDAWNFCELFLSNFRVSLIPNVYLLAGYSHAGTTTKNLYVAGNVYDS